MKTPDEAQLFEEWKREKCTEEMHNVVHFAKQTVYDSVRGLWEGLATIDDIKKIHDEAYSALLEIKKKYETPESADDED